MTIQFTHKGKKVTGKIVSSNDVTDIIIVFPDSYIGESGWSHCFQRKQNKWSSDTFLKQKYPATYSDLLSQINAI